MNPCAWMCASLGRPMPICLALAARERFKRDLLDRLSFEVLFLSAPERRERREDILLLARHFAARMALELGGSRRISPLEPCAPSKPTIARKYSRTQECRGAGRSTAARGPPSGRLSSTLLRRVPVFAWRSGIACRGGCFAAVRSRWYGHRPFKAGKESLPDCHRAPLSWRPCKLRCGPANFIRERPQNTLG